MKSKLDYAAVAARVTLEFATCLAIGSLVCPSLASAHAQTTTTVQFDREIVRILNNHCVMCHADGGLAFPLVTYEQTYGARWSIRQDALGRRMPPWAAVPGFGEFANSNELTQREVDFLTSWAESFGPRNNGEVYTVVANMPAKSKPVQARTDLQRWALGKPDLQLALPANAVAPRKPAPPQGSVQEQIQRTILDPKLTAERWLRGWEYEPGDRRVVHAVSFFIQQSGQWIGSWTPWQGFVSLPMGLAYRLPAGSHLVAEIHYYGATQPVVDQGSLGLYFTERPSRRALSNRVLEPKQVASPAGQVGPATATTRKRVATTTLETDLNIVALQPVIRAGVRSIEVTARGAAGATQVLLFAKDIPLEWPTPYVFARPIALAKGTELSVIEHYAGAISREETPSPAPIPVTFIAYQGVTLQTDVPKVQQSDPAKRIDSPNAPPAAQRFQLSGTVKSVDAAGGRLVVQHGDIPGFMGAMTMSYSVGSHENLKGLAAGDRIHSDVVVSGADSHLENIQVTGRAK